MSNKRSTDKKMNLLLYKEKILNDIKYYEKRINEDLLANASTSVNYIDSSDSEDERPFSIDSGPMVNQLETQQKMLQTGLLATQELASLKVLQSQVDVMVDDPVFNGEAPVTQPGSWKEVNADCRIDLVPFSTTFYVHKANGLFGAKSYHSLKVLPVKPAQEVELSKSVLTRLRTPSDAVEVLRSYSVAYRSRRTTLAKLADKFAHNLLMEPMPGGGYILKCANLLEISWVLENKWSQVAPFYHKMIFDLENMDECYIKIIRYAHKQLADPSTDTNMRTLILAKIITTCLEAQGASELQESMESDKESVKSIEKRRLTLDDEAPEPKKLRNGNKNDGKKDGNTTEDVNNKDNRNNKDNIDDQIMAPPKSLPKKAKPKGKENTDQNRKSAKRAAAENETSTGKKAKTDNNVRQNENEKDKAGEKGNQNKGKNNAKNKDKVTTNTEKSAKSAEKVNLQMKTNAEEKPDLNQNDNTENLKNKEKVAKNHNEKDKVPVIQKQKRSQVEKETAKDSQKAKTVKSKNQEEKAKSAKEKNDIQEDSTDNEQKNRYVQSQEKAKENVVKDADSENVADKIVASSKNDPNTKNAEPHKKPSKNKVAVSSKNDSKAKNSENQKSPTDKAIATSKNTPKTKESDALEVNNKEKKVISPKNNLVAKNKAKKGTDNARLVEIDDIPIMSVNYNNDNVPKKDNINMKTTKNKKGNSKSTNANKNGPKKDPNYNKLANVEPTNVNKETTKDSNALNVKKTIVNKNIQTKTKPSADNAVPKDKHPQKNNANKAEHNQITSNINDENSKNQHKPSTQKTITQNLKPPKQNDSEKKTVTKAIVTNDQKNKENLNEKNTEKYLETTENILSEIVTKKMAKISNVATTKEHTANVGDIKKPTKIDEEKSKKSIKTLTHKNAGKKVGEKFNISRKFKHVNAGNIAVNLKTGKKTDSGSKTKIPMKLSVHESLRKKNPLHISPRKLASSFRSSSASSVKQKNYFTNIPRLLKKPDPKKISK